jgi:hypothetical protein
MFRISFRLPSLRPGRRADHTGRPRFVDTRATHRLHSAQPQRSGVILAAALVLSLALAPVGNAQDEECVPTDHESPCALADGAVVSEYISEQGGRNYFWFGVPEPGTHAHIELKDLPADYDLYLFGSIDPEPMAKSVNQDTTPEVIDVTLQDASVYYIYVVSDPSLPFDADDPYTLTLSLLRPAPTPAPALATPTPALATVTPVFLNTVPPVLGRTSSASAQTIRDAGFSPVVRVVDQFSEHGPDTVAGQVPSAGTPLAAGGEVVLYVASGNVQVPSVVGRTVADAEAVLHAAGFRTDTIRRPSDTLALGTAIGTDPSANQVVPGGSEVRLFISQGN